MSHPFRTFCGVMIAGALVLAFAGGCGDDDPRPLPIEPPPGEEPRVPVLTVEPDTLLLDDGTTEGAIELGCNVAGDPWRLTGVPPWASVAPDTGTTGEFPATISIATRPDTLAAGPRRAWLTFTGSESGCRVYLQLEVGVLRLLDASPDTLRFPDGVDSVHLLLENAGNTGVSWTLQPRDSWIDVSSRVGFCAAGGRFDVTVSVRRGMLPSGDLQGALRLTSNAESPLIDIPVTMAVPVLPRLSVEPDSLVFGFFEEVRTATIRNTGNVRLDWTATPWDAAVGAAPGSGALDPGESMELTVTADRDEVDGGVGFTGITIDNSHGGHDPLPIRIMEYDYDFIPLPDGIIDMEYDANHERMIVVASSYNRLLSIDVADGHVDTLELHWAPTCVSVSPDGAHCVVGHDGQITWLELAPLQALAYFSVSADVHDVVLGGNGFAYCFPSGGGNTTIRCIELADGTETQHVGATVYQGTTAHLHPNGDWIYAADTGVYPPDIEKYDIRGGTAVYVDDSPYSGEFSIGAELWIAGSGDFLVARSSQVFACSAEPAEDMIYLATLQETGYLRSVATSTVTERIYAIPLDTGRIRSYDDNGFGFVGEASPPAWPLLAGDGSVTFHPTEAQRIFTRPSGLGVVLQIIDPQTSDSALLGLDTGELY